VKNLYQDKQLKEAHALVTDGGLTEIKYHSFDVTDKESVQSFAKHLTQTHGDGIDIFINNAGIALDGFSRIAPSRTYFVETNNRM
jgi:carbonyl reductase 1